MTRPDALAALLLLAAACSSGADAAPPPCRALSGPCELEDGTEGVCRPVRGTADAGRDVIAPECVAPTT